MAQRKAGKNAARRFRRTIDAQLRRAMEGFVNTAAPADKLLLREILWSWEATQGGDHEDIPLASAIESTLQNKTLIVMEPKSEPKKHARRK